MRSVFSNTLIVTLGKDGAIAAHEGELIRVSAPEITPVDTVGAGDTFCGYLAAALEAGLEIEEAIVRATVAGALRLPQIRRPAVDSPGGRSGRGNGRMRQIS